MRIANPIYDTVFKYLMEDNQLAKLLLSTILGEEIVELDFKPQEHTTTVALRSLTVYRLDFAATVENAQGERRQVLIEIQKAKLASDIMRFRRYLGDQYRNPRNVQELVDAARGYSKRRALPLLTIDFLGHGLEYTKAPVIRVRRECIDATTGERLSRKEPFIEGLTHDSTIIQIPHLGRERRTEIEAMLQIFDQGLVVDDRHVLEIDESEVPERYRPLLRRLQRAIAEPELAEAMAVEDEVLEDLQDLERWVEYERAEKERERAEKEQERAEKEQERAAKEQERAEKERLLERLREAGLEP
jgi:hypothetical protein